MIGEATPDLFGWIFMGFTSIFLIAVGLSMDAFAVSITSGARTRQRLVQHALVIALFFGFFQALMPTLGWMAGVGLRGLISSVDHWIAFVLLTIIGCKMIFEASVDRPAAGDEKAIVNLTVGVLFTLAVATSIDALIVGVSLSILKSSILRPALIIGAVTFVISAAGVLIGHRFGRILGKKFEFLGGLILIAIGVKILLAHIL